MAATFFTLDEVIDHLITVVAHKADDKGLEFVLDIAPDVPRYLVGDPLRLGRILNLGNNAIKFTQQGEISITVGIRSIQQSAGSPGIHSTGYRHWHDRRADRRPYSSPSVRPTAPSPGNMVGTGLGLSISKRLVEMMEGTIGVDSQLEVVTSSASMSG